MHEYTVSDHWTDCTSYDRDQKLIFAILLRFRCSRPYHYRAADILDTYNDKLHKYNPEAQGVVADQISTQCYPGKISVLNAGIAKEYRCYISVTDKLAKKHNLGQIWVETKKQLHPIINELAKCEDNE